MSHGIRSWRERARSPRTPDEYLDRAMRSLRMARDLAAGMDGPLCRGDASISASLRADVARALDDIESARSTLGRDLDAEVRN